MKRRLPPSFYNATTLFGATLAAIMLSMILFLFVLDAFAGFSNNYMGLITYIALPGVMLFGLAIAVIGILRAAKQIRKQGSIPDLPILDLNQKGTRNAVTLIGVGGLVLMALSGFGSYQAYEYTESVKFCGTTCHDVMKPEYVAYQASPHAKVTCATCHVGNGAGWYVKSKLSGAYQVYSVLFNKYHRPIETPVHNLRPAKETCEECHSPKHFFSQKLREHNYFLSDETNTPYKVSMLVKIGGTEQGMSEGIHAHMYLNNQISYISTDRQRQVIPYVEAKDQNGKITIYRDTESKATEADLKKGERRLVDCIDCHNRPTHIYHHPETSVNTAMSQGAIDPKLKNIKSISVAALEKPYKTEDQALAGIKADVEKEMKDSLSDPATAKLVSQAVVSLQGIYKQNYFPEMGVSWKGFPSNIDHMHSLGCFRCHDDKHVSSSGKVISKNCTTCHTIINQGDPRKPGPGSLNGLAFQHPVDVGDEWKTQPCKNCHASTGE